MLLERNHVLDTRCSTAHTLLRRASAVALLVAVTLGFGITAARGQEPPAPDKKKTRTVTEPRAASVELHLKATYTAPQQLEKFMGIVARTGGRILNTRITNGKSKSEPKTLRATLHLPSSPNTRAIDALQRISASSGLSVIAVKRSQPTQNPVMRVSTASDRAKTPKISVSFKDAPIQKVVETIAQMANANIVLSPEVQGALSMRLKDVPWRSALDAAALSLGYVVVDLNDDILVVTTRKGASLVRKDRSKGN